MDATENQTLLKSTLSNRSPRSLSAVALLALAPVATFALTQDAMAGAVTAINVVLIFTSVYLLLSPTEGGGHGSDDPTA
ncbi:hypothetical protein [Halorussus halobius]|uniref:hypothetical protein n=1 Tax=Halorussus halobius TaxID=1710537 RepID=UPI001B2FFECB|nr:hypothetical protein [Halorussus halobius]